MIAVEVVVRVEATGVAMVAMEVAVVETGHSTTRTIFAEAVAESGNSCACKIWSLNVEHVRFAGKRFKVPMHRLAFALEIYALWFHVMWCDVKSRNLSSSRPSISGCSEKWNSLFMEDVLVVLEELIVTWVMLARKVNDKGDEGDR
jgi:hypothetical protein